MNDWENNDQTPEENGQEPEQEPEREPEQEPEASAPALYTWDGSDAKKNHRKKKTRSFFLVAAVCVLLAAAIAVPTVFYAQSFQGQTPSVSNTVSGTESDEEVSREPLRDVVLKPSDSYVEASSLTELYEKCIESCVSIISYQSTGSALGSGFVLTEKGHIATNQHVVDGGERFEVVLHDGTKLDAELVGEDPLRDLAVVKVERTDLVPLEIGRSSELKVGQQVVAIGTPHDLILAGTMTQGIISGLDRMLPVDNSSGGSKTMRMIQTDATINPGNSGGPLLNMAGQVVGVNSMKLIQDYEGIGFSIPMDTAIDIFEQLINFGKVVDAPDDDSVVLPGYLGIRIKNISYPFYGIQVALVEPDSAAEKAGMKVDDIIISFNGTKVENIDDLDAAMKPFKPGDTVELIVMRYNQSTKRFSEVHLHVTLGKRAS